MDQAMISLKDNGERVVTACNKLAHEPLIVQVEQFGVRNELPGLLISAHLAPISAQLYNIEVTDNVIQKLLSVEWDKTVLDPENSQSQNWGHAPFAQDPDAIRQTSQLGTEAIFQQYT